MSVNSQVLDKLRVTIGSAHYDFTQELTTSAGAIPPVDSTTIFKEPRNNGGNL